MTYTPPGCVGVLTCIIRHCALKTGRVLFTEPRSNELIKHYLHRAIFKAGVGSIFLASLSNNNL